MPKNGKKMQMILFERYAKKAEKNEKMRKNMYAKKRQPNNFLKNYAKKGKMQQKGTWGVFQKTVLEPLIVSM